MEKIIDKKDKTTTKNNKNNKESFKLKLTFGELNEINDKKYFKTPQIQIQLGEDRINNIAKTWKNMPEFILTERPLTFVVLKSDNETEYWLIDGQHKFNAAIKLHKDENINDSLDCTFIECDSKEEINGLFDLINADSEKSKIMINSDIFVKKIMIDLKTKIKEKFKNCYKEKSSKKSDIMTADEFIDELVKYNVFVDWNNNEIPNSDEFIVMLDDKNKKFFKDACYLENVNRKDVDDLFSKEEIEIIEKCKNCMFFKNNNFREYFSNLICKSNMKPIHNYKNKRLPISEKIKETVWKNEYKSKPIGICPIFNCNNQLEKKNYQCGHIISVYNGGTNDTSNLRPICAECNLKMSSTNWDEYEKQIMFEHYKKKCYDCREKQKIQDIFIKDKKIYCEKCYNKDDSDSD